jgi:hypothetical protein
MCVGLVSSHSSFYVLFCSDRQWSHKWCRIREATCSSLEFDGKKLSQSHWQKDCPHDWQNSRFEFFFFFFFLFCFNVMFNSHQPCDLLIIEFVPTLPWESFYHQLFNAWNSFVAIRQWYQLSRSSSQRDWIIWLVWWSKVRSRTSDLALQTERWCQHHHRTCRVWYQETFH